MIKSNTNAVAVKLGSGSYVPTADTAALLEEIGGLPTLKLFVSVFYEKMFKDKMISKFVNDQGDPHAERLSSWIAEKMGDKTQPWSNEKKTRCPIANTKKLGDGSMHLVHDRQSAHHAAWFSPHRPPKELGRRFNLPDTRVWMRLMFWALRETKVLNIYPRFADWFVKFISHFIRIYENSAPPFAIESLMWSENEDNIKSYFDNGNRMTDL